MTKLDDFFGKMQVGEAEAGFELKRVEAIAELNVVAYEFSHPTGARLVWLANDDQNRSFAIAFKTPPKDSTGVFHILEHSVLCGSNKFPVKEPFVNLIKSSMQTFLNAMTFADKTVYPVASTNVKDLENLMDVYLDAVFHPQIYVKKEIFEQEGHHLELDVEDKLSINGVVYNEMKGALSDPQRLLGAKLSAQLFPDSCYGKVSGGDPEVIPELSYEDFLDQHERHYQLSNSYTILYGDLDIRRELRFIGERFDAVAPSEKSPNPLVLQKPVAPAPISFELNTSADNASVAIGYVFTTALDYRKNSAAQLLVDVLCDSNEAPLKKTIMAAGICDNFSASFIDHQLQPMMVFKIRGAKPNSAATFKQLLERSCADLIAQGIDKKRIRARLAAIEFELREADTSGYGDGLLYSIGMLGSWIYDEEHPFERIRFEKDIQELKKNIDTDYYEQLLAEIVLENDHQAMVELIPSEDAVDVEAKNLALQQAALTEEDKAAIRENVARLREVQEAPDSPEALTSLPRLRIEDIEEAPHTESYKLLDKPHKCIWHNLDTKGILYATYYFGLNKIRFEELPLIGILESILTELPTQNYSADELDTELDLRLGDFETYSVMSNRLKEPHKLNALFAVYAASLPENIKYLIDLPQEIWSSSDYSDFERIFKVLTQLRLAFSSQFTNYGHAFAISRSQAQLLEESRIHEEIKGVNFYNYLCELLDNWDERKSALQEKLESLTKRLFSADNLLISLAGSEEAVEAFWAAAEDLNLSKTDYPEVFSVPQGTFKNEAFIINGSVNYVALSNKKLKVNLDNFSKLTIANKTLSYNHLWNEVRVKGGAYGVGFSRKLTGYSGFWTYRDPNIDESVERMLASKPYLQSWSDENNELEGYIVSSVASIDAPKKPRMIQRSQVEQYFTGITEADREKIREEALHITKADVNSVAELLPEALDDSIICVFGTKDAIEASNIHFDSIQDLTK